MVHLKRVVYITPFFFCPGGCQAICRHGRGECVPDQSRYYGRLGPDRILYPDVFKPGLYFKWVLSLLPDARKRQHQQRSEYPYPDDFMYEGSVHSWGKITNFMGFTHHAIFPRYVSILKTYLLFTYLWVYFLTCAQSSH